MQCVFTQWSDRLHAPPVRYAVALAATAAGTVLRLAVDPLLGDTAQFSTFFVAVVVSGAIGGWGPAILSTILSALAVDYLFIEPHYAFYPIQLGDFIAVLIFLFGGVCIAWISGRLHAARVVAAENEGRLRATFENAGVGILETDPEDHFVSANPRICRMLGYTRNELMSMAVPELTWPDDVAVTREMCARVHRREVPQVTYEKRYRKRDGSPLWVSVTVSAIRDAAGRYLQGIGVVEDITERKRAEAALRESEAKFRTIAENARAIFGMAQDGRFVYANPYLLEMSGYTFEELSNLDIADLVHPSCREQVLDYARRRLIGENLPAQYEFPMVTKSGETRWLDMCVGLIQYKGRPALVGAAYDITDRRHAEQELREAKAFAEQAKASAEQAKAAVEDAGRAKDHFLAVLSHELRNPLTPVLAMISMLQEDNRFDSETRDNLEVIRRNVDLEARLIDDLLDVTRIARGKIELHKERTDLCEIVRRAVEVCRPDIEARRLEFGVDCCTGPFLVEADPARLQQVFWNLLKNSIKFTTHGGCVGIRCQPIEPGAVAVEVSDSGIGIEPEAIGRIFNAFEQGDLARARQFGGLGLGLTISKSLVEMHGGTITAYSEGKGKGAQFRVQLPLAVVQRGGLPPPGTEHPAKIQPREAERLSILLVEDHGDTARIVKRLLERRGHHVQTAGDVATAREIGGREPFDLLVSDLGLPDGSGLDLLEDLRKSRPNLRGIALSGYGTESDVRRSREAGFAEHLTKPVQIPVLQAAIMRVATGTPETPDNSRVPSEPP